jgi:alpha-tubulin suppressor-like RCC1 family protein
MRSLRSFWLVFGVGVFFTLLWVCPALCGVDVNLSNMVSSKGHIVYQSGKLQSPFISFTQIVSGYYCSYGLDSDGTVWSWGTNVRGCLGYEGDVRMGGEMGFYGSRVPKKVKGPGGVGYLTGVTKIAAGYEHALALKSDGTVWAWGDNFYGQLGNNKNYQNYEDGHEFEQYPVQVVNSEGNGYLEGIVDISAGGNFSLAVDQNGYVRAWGNNEEYQLGDLTRYDRKRPVTVKKPGGATLTGIVEVSAGWWHAAARNSDGEVYVWGLNRWDVNENPRLGVNPGGLYVIGAYKVGGVSNVIKISTANDDPNILALKSDGTVLAWGANWNGQLCQGTNGNVIVSPATVKGPGGEGNLTNVIQISAGPFHSTFLLSDGTVWACGYNGYGTLGQGDNQDDSSYPVQVKSPSGEGYLTGISKIGEKPVGSSSFAITSSGSVLGWGACWPRPSPRATTSGGASPPSALAGWAAHWATPQRGSSIVAIGWPTGRGTGGRL